MVYISGSGTIHQNAPWGIGRVIALFYGLFAFVILFFKTLVGLDTSTTLGSRFGGSGSFRSNGGGGGGGGGGGPGSGPGRGPRRIRTMSDINPPTIGGCPGGSCGL